MNIEKRIASLDAEMTFTSVDQISEVFGVFSTGPGLAYLQAVKDFHQKGSVPISPMSAVRTANALLEYGRRWELAVRTWMSQSQLTNRQSRIQLLSLLACNWFGEASIAETLWNKDPATHPWTHLSSHLLDTARKILDLKLEIRRSENLPESFKRGWHADFVSICLRHSMTERLD